MPAYAQAYTGHSELLMIHRLFTFLLATLATLPCAVAVPTKPDANLLRLHQVQLATQGALGDFYLMYGVDPDPTHAQSMELRIQTATRNLAGMAELPGTNSSTLLTQLEQQWRAYVQLLSGLTGELQRQGSTSGGDIAELVSLNRQLVTLCRSLEVSLRQESPLPPPRLAEQSRNLSLLMQNIATDYIAHSVGANSLGGDGKALDAQAEEFATRLATLQDHPEQPAEARQALADIARKWRYIEPSLKHYNEAAVPSLVNRYSARIIEELTQLETSSSVPAPDSSGR
ncbi:hypothetical protein NVV93_00715 [Pseudomonas sp. LS44]|uniref:hypothetical protein n=1 Tax=Pseudomonas sp. LS44 TaxID=1357074 RepID=UPI00215B71FB|nr:hypothetical protein [Pseudomonas sp. LS44]UVE17958.1 hypothetical protein NVV93_00715 [Pseudomonas sp. LS44]